MISSRDFFLSVTLLLFYVLLLVIATLHFFLCSISITLQSTSHFSKPLSYEWNTVCPDVNVRPFSSPCAHCAGWSHAYYPSCGKSAWLLSVKHYNILTGHNSRLLSGLKLLWQTQSVLFMYPKGITGVAPIWLPQYGCKWLRCCEIFLCITGRREDKWTPLVGHRVTHTWFDLWTLKLKLRDYSSAHIRTWAAINSVYWCGSRDFPFQTGAVYQSGCYHAKWLHCTAFGKRAEDEPSEENQDPREEEEDEGAQAGLEHVGHGNGGAVRRTLMETHFAA